MDLFAEIVALTAALDAEAIEYAICGGVALAVSRPQDIVDIQRLREVGDAP